MRRICSLARRCVDDFNMIQEGDNIAVGVSGGKDSLLTLAALSELSKFYPKRFAVRAITLDMGFEGVDLSPVQTFCDERGVNLTIVKTQIAEIVFNVRKESHPCSLCAKMRRGALHEAALSVGCKKIALGHHYDDAVETFLLSLFYEGRISCFRPVTYLDRKDVTIIRPLLYVTEEHVLEKSRNLPVVNNPCPANGNTKRQETKEFLKSLENRYPNIKGQIFGAMSRYPLNGWDLLR